MLLFVQTGDTAAMTNRSTRKEAARRDGLWVCEPVWVKRAGSEGLSGQTALVAETGRRLVTMPDDRVRRDLTASRVAVITGVIFVFAGLVKFVFHAWELRAFRAFGLPWPGAFEIVAGVLEVGGGALLIARSLVVPISGLLAATMVVAIGASGIGHGDVVPSLTLAPALLGSLVWLMGRTARRG